MRDVTLVILNSLRIKCHIRRPLSQDYIATIVVMLDKLNELRIIKKIIIKITKNLNTKNVICSKPIEMFYHPVDR